MVDLSKLSPFIKWIFFGISIGVFVWVTMYITKSFKSQCSAGYTFSKQYNKCIQQCGEGQTYYLSVDACRKCDPDTQQEIEGVCKDKCLGGEEFQHCGSVCYLPSNRVCLDENQGKLCYKNAYYDREYLNGSVTYDNAKRTLTFSNSDLSKVEANDNLEIMDVNNKTTTVTVKSVQTNDKTITLNDSNGDSPLPKDINIKSIAKIGKFCCNENEIYNNDKKQCIQCDGTLCCGICYSKTESEGKKCLEKICTMCRTGDVMSDTNCCADENGTSRKCGSDCCSSYKGSYCDKTDPTNPKCKIKCGDTSCDAQTQACREHKYKDASGADQTQDVCITFDCIWDGQISYTPEPIGNLPICQGSENNANKYYWCQVGGNGGNYKRSALNYACANRANP